MAPVLDRFYVEVGRRIQGLRSTKGLSQAELGLRLEPPVTRASIANLENGRQRLLLHTFVQIARILECEFQDLVPADIRPPADRDLQTEVASELKKLRIPNQASARISRQFLKSPPKDAK